MAVLAHETWVGADGDPWPSPWSFVGGYEFQTVDTPPTIVNNAGRLSSGTGNSQGWGYSFGQADLPGSFGDFDLKCRMVFQKTALMEQYADFCFGQQSGGQHTGEPLVSFEIARWDDVWQGRFWDASLGNMVGTYQNFANGDDLGNVPIWIRVKRSGTDLLGKVWKVGETEPDWTCHASGDAWYANVGNMSLVVTNGADDAEQWADFEELTVTDGQTVLGYYGEQPVSRAYLGSQQLNAIVLG